MGGRSHPEWDASQLLIAEYTQLREEIIKLTELQFQVTAVTVVAFGTVLSVGVQVENAAIILVYPLLSLILAISWLHHSHLIARIAIYIRTRHEQRVGVHHLGWEHFVDRTPLPRGRLAYWGMRAVFVISSILSIGASLTVASFNAPFVALLTFASLTTIATATMFYFWAEPSPELSGPQPSP